MIRQKEQREEIIIDLDGPQGNAFYLLGFAQRYGRNPEQLVNQMKESDYTNLVRLFEEEFGDWVILETTQPNLLEIMK